nr:MAG TPA: hypothetical protein [Caudoviricetes sp.]
MNSNALRSSFRSMSPSIHARPEALLIQILPP